MGQVDIAAARGDGIKTVLDKVASGTTFSEDEIRTALELLMTSAASDVHRAAFLMGLRVRGETIAEITGAARLLRARMHAVSAPPGTIDIVGTGGDGHGTYNVSTCAALVAAGAGATVAKHGNRSVSSRSGASDVLSALGVKIDIDADKVADAIRQAGIGFMWAPMHHPAMKTWAPARAELKVRTLFNVLGPIANPANVKRQVVGVYDVRWVEPIADALKGLGSEHAWVVHGSDGLDELTTTGPSTVAEVKDGAVSVFEISPEQAGLERTSLSSLQGGDAQENAAAIRAVLDGAAGPFRDIVLLNTAAALVVADKAANLIDGVEIASRAIDSGAARAVLDKLVAVTNADA
ncbi:Anthranilate phosphoribosyltransferase [Candidatus Filomicrobium marinum]|uniref:Anthranilate phosphoribosyltransferase n=2 Tax=Filomicrobium TaxID=119044 RepID=A0A0D6JIR6_9HYPH|nr:MULTISPECIES: anthranilate phosphoribosyltransferase [Filomicrobium]MCV0369370.1 anthranilate phosphoribosyltransferase [Filomicrobium sp.]CFX41054.1 Anthranilate phosphoribosyltransferase [Candidatus Filomicrobium marinum]CPR21231.1 Anthranilate phosphoribosyltransferase [Candidatus Filomicrobium marinum]SDP25455.1 anthranilate phosphoribosyltransferase [Filomicrobium insigne]